VIVLDAGALIAFERQSAKMRAVVREAASQARVILIPAPVLAQVWRKPAEQVLLRALAYSRFSRIVALDGALAEAVGTLCARTKTRDTTDACVAILARQWNALVLTRDPGDIRRLDPTLRVELV
jgi:predicted nucleic acid-binding protein